MDALDYIIEAQQRGILPTLEATKVKGKCRHCGKIVGRGVWMHEKTCKDAKQK